MSMSALVLVLLALSALAYFLGRQRSLALAGRAGGLRNLHSLPTYYGFYTALWCGLPALAVLGVWGMFQSTIVTELLVQDLPAELRELPPDRLGLVINDIHNLVTGSAVSHEVTPQIQAAAEHLRELRSTAYAALTVIVLALGIGGGTIA